MKNLLKSFSILAITFASCAKEMPVDQQSGSTVSVKVEVSSTSPNQVVPSSTASSVVLEYDITVSESGWAVTTNNSPRMTFSLNLTNLYVTINGNQRATMNSYMAGNEIQLALNYNLISGVNKVRVYAKIPDNAGNSMEVRLLKGGLVTNTNSTITKTYELVTQDISKTVSIVTTPSPATVTLSLLSPTEVNFIGTSAQLFEYDITMSESGWQIGSTTNSPKWVVNQNLSNVYLVVNNIQKTTIGNYVAGSEIQLSSTASLNSGANKVKMYATLSNASVSSLEVKLLKGGVINNPSTGKTYELVNQDISKVLDVKDKRFFVNKDNNLGNIAINRVDTASFKTWGQFNLTNNSNLLARVDKVTVTLTQDGYTKLDNTSLPKIGEIKKIRLVTPDSIYTASSVLADNVFVFSVLVPSSSTKNFKVEGKILSTTSGQFISTVVTEAKWTNMAYSIGNAGDPTLLQTVSVQ